MPEDNWSDQGRAPGIINHPLLDILPGGHDRIVKNEETGDRRTIHVHDGQSTGDAIAKGQFRDDEE